MDMIDDRLKIPIKRQGYLDMYNGIDILQTRYYIEINLKTFIDKIFEPYLATWMKTASLERESSVDCLFLVSNDAAREISLKIQVCPSAWWWHIFRQVRKYCTKPPSKL